MAKKNIPAEISKQIHLNAEEYATLKSVKGDTKDYKRIRAAALHGANRICKELSIALDIIDRLAEDDAGNSSYTPDEIYFSLRLEARKFLKKI